MVKDVIDCTTIRRLAFVCTSCNTPFLHPSVATDDWLATVFTMTLEDKRAHCVGAQLRRSWTPWLFLLDAPNSVK